ncbi:hypothetical protein AYI68_g5436 [Smittium mucronatum]|uniref:Uncharacterized protein n=1 Tax=Smittium mucronatum TaxID=133383 RepID=A0A1R0GU91_9FUNG|nr:hypothetical protein AYI68_g5436 [Smittium mucronatum]
MKLVSSISISFSFLLAIAENILFGDQNANIVEYGSSNLVFANNQVKRNTQIAQDLEHANLKFQTRNLPSIRKKRKRDEVYSDKVSGVTEEDEENENHSAYLNELKNINIKICQEFLTGKIFADNINKINTTLTLFQKNIRKVASAGRSIKDVKLMPIYFKSLFEEIKDNIISSANDLEKKENILSRLMHKDFESYLTSCKKIITKLETDIDLLITDQAPRDKRHITDGNLNFRQSKIDAMDKISALLEYFLINEGNKSILEKYSGFNHF